MDPNLTLLLVALLNAFTAYLTWSTRTIALESKNIALKTELNTNSMREQLVAATDKAAHATGKEEGRAEGAATAAILAKEILEAKAP